MASIKLPIIGVTPKDGRWQDIMAGFSSHMNPDITKKSLRRYFRDPVHSGYLASLLFMKHLIFSPDSYWRLLREVKRTLVTLLSSLARLLSSADASEPSIIFGSAKMKFSDELMRHCGCGECVRTVSLLEKFTEGGRLPRLTPHADHCEIEKLLMSIHNKALMGTRLSINEDHLAALLMDPINYDEFESNSDMAILASILHVGSLFFMISRLEQEIYLGIEDEIVRIVTAEDATPFPCSSQRALDMVTAQRGLPCHEVVLPRLPSHQHLPSEERVTLSRSLLDKLTSVLKTGSTLSVSSFPCALEPVSEDDTEPPIVDERAFTVGAGDETLPRDRLWLSRNADASGKGARKHAGTRKRVDLPEIDPLASLNAKLSKLRMSESSVIPDDDEFVSPGEDSLFGHAEDSLFGYVNPGPWDLLNDAIPDKAAGARQSRARGRGFAGPSFGAKKGGRRKSLPRSVNQRPDNPYYRVTA